MHGSTLSNKTNDYELSAELVNHGLSITLRIFQHDHRMNYRTALNDDDLPPEIQKNLSSVENIFQCLSDQTNYQIALENGQITIKTIHIIGKKEKHIFTKLKLEESPLNDYELLSIHVNRLTQKTQAIENNIQAIIQQQIHQLKGQVINRTINDIQPLIHNISFRNNDQEVEELSKRVENIERKLSTFERKFEEIYHINERLTKIQHRLAEKNDHQDNPIHIISDSGNGSQSVTLIAPEKAKMAEQSTLEINKFQDLFETKTEYAHLFCFNQSQRSITYQGEDNELTQLLCKASIPKNQLYIYKVRIIKCKKSTIFVGVVNKTQRKEARTSFKSGSAITYYGGGRIWFGPQAELKFVETKNEFVEGDEVIVIVDRENGKIEWKVNEKNAGVIEHPMLTEDNKEWVPYFQFKKKDDSIQWLN